MRSSPPFAAPDRRAGGPGERPSDARRDLGTVATLLACVAVALAVAPALRVPAHVDRVTVVNPHRWHVDVAVTDGERDGWHQIGAVRRETRQSYLQVPDQGHTWTFRFRYAGHRTDIRVSRAQLAEDGWRVAVPDQLALDLGAAGIAETPP